MGCFNAICGMSGITIMGGDRIRYLLLVENKSKRSCGVSKSWYLRSPAIEATYNEYGSIYLEEGPKSLARRVMFESFDIDAVSVKVNDKGLLLISTFPFVSEGPRLTALNEDGLWVRNSATTRNYGYPDTSEDEALRLQVYGFEEPRRVRPIMVREDVWDLFLSQPYRSYSDGNHTLKSFTELAEASCEQEWKITQSGSDRVDLYLIRNADNLFRMFLRNSDAFGSFGLTESISMAIKLSKTYSSFKPFIKAIAETAYAQMMFSLLNGQWHPIEGDSQEAPFKEQRKLFQGFAKICASAEKQLKKDD